MGRRRRNREPVTVRIDRLEPRHVSGLDAEGRRWKVRAAGVGATVLARPGRKGTARRLELVEPAPDAVEPRCPLFGTCGGCWLQEMPLARQRSEKQRLVERLVEPPPGVRVHPVRGGPSAFHYRNKLELSWSPRRYTPEGAPRPEAGEVGSWLGFHPPGWFGKVVPVAACPLGTKAMNRVIGRVAELAPGPAWDARDHVGDWRHLVVRDAGPGAPGEARVLATLVTSTTADPARVEAVGAAVAELPGVTGVLHVVTDRPSEVAEGELARVLHGDPTLRFEVGGLRLELPHDAFFQVNTEGAEVLLDTVAEAARPPGGAPGGTLVDLYCGAGFLGLGLARRGAFRRVVGVELHPGAVETARRNAALNGVAGTWEAGAVEAVLPGLDLGPAEGRVVVVDPPRAGLHPRAARFLAGLEAAVLVHVACNPASLARDRAVLEAGGWRMTDLWTVDLFPQTLHVEAVARFERGAAPLP